MSGRPIGHFWHSPRHALFASIYRILKPTIERLLSALPHRSYWPGSLNAHLAVHTSRSSITARVLLAARIN